MGPSSGPSWLFGDAARALHTETRPCDGGRVGTAHARTMDAQSALPASDKGIGASSPCLRIRELGPLGPDLSPSPPSPVVGTGVAPIQIGPPATGSHFTRPASSSLVTGRLCRASFLQPTEAPEIGDRESAMPMEELSRFPGIARGRGAAGTTPLPDLNADFLGNCAQQRNHEPFLQGYLAGWQSVRGDQPPLIPPCPVLVGAAMYMVGFSRGARDARSMTPDDPLRLE